MNSERFDRQMFRIAVGAFPWRRAVTSVHVHHTWKPRLREWSAEKTLRAMREYHVSQRGFMDIAQHATIAPDGGIWAGRDWNYPPASNASDNGNSRSGPFMFEMIGDFDLGRDVLEGEQFISAIHVCSTICRKFMIDPAIGVVGHRELGSPKTCPGSGIDMDDFRKQVVLYATGGAPK